MALNPLLKKLVTTSAQKFKSTNSKSVKLKEGRNVFRLIAPAPGEVPWVGENGMFYRELGVHWIKPDSNAKPVAVVGSEEIVYGRISALSAAIDMAIASAHDEDSKKLYTEWKAKKSILVNVVNRDAGDEVQVLDLSVTTFGKILDLVNLYDDQGIDILSHDIGIDLVVTKSGKGLNTNYDVSVLPLAPGKTCKPVTKEQVAAAENLDDFITSNFFRGEDTKALNAVVQIAGISMPRLGAPATPVAALTSSAATVADAPIAQPITAPPAAAVAAPATAPAVDPAAQIAALQAQLAQQQAALAQQQAAATQAAAPAPVTPTTSISDLGQDEQDDLLAQLNSIGV